MTPYEQFKLRLATLENAMLSDVSSLPTLHTQIRKQLETYPEVVTLLTEEDIGKIVSSAALVAGEVLGKEEKKKENKASKASKKAMNNITLDDL